MTNIKSYIKGFDTLTDSLNKANITESKRFLFQYRQPSVSSWQAYQLLSRAVAKFSYDEKLCKPLEDLQYKFYSRCDLNNINREIIREHLDLNEAGKNAFIAAERLRKEIERQNKLKEMQDERSASDVF